MNRIEIFQPRWHDRRVLVACHKVGANNEIVFTKAPTLTGTYHMRGESMMKYPIESNGKIDCYAVPLIAFEVNEVKS